MQLSFFFFLLNTPSTSAAGYSVVCIEAEIALTWSCARGQRRVWTEAKVAKMEARVEVLGCGEEVKVWGGTPGPEKKLVSTVRG